MCAFYEEILSINEAEITYSVEIYAKCTDAIMLKKRRITPDPAGASRVIITPW